MSNRGGRKVFSPSTCRTDCTGVNQQTISKIQMRFRVSLSSFENFDPIIENMIKTRFRQRFRTKFVHAGAASLSLPPDI
jgi:hypothetical protein